MSRQRARAVARRKAKHKGRDQERSARRAQLERILALMGLRDWFRHLRPGILDYLYRGINPKPRVVLDPDHRGDRDMADRAKDLQRTLDRVTIEVGSVELSFNDYFSVVVMMIGAIRANGADRSRRNPFSEPAAAVEEFVRRYDTPIREAYRVRALAALHESSAIDASISTARQGYEQRGERLVFTTTLGRTRAQSRTIEAGGIGRRAYRCGVFDDLDSGEVEWIGWDARALGLESSGRLPVYIQSHALIQARDRLGIKPDHLINPGLCWSLLEPVLIPISAGAYLVEYRFHDHKLGYLVAELVGDAVLIRTFLLVTMQGTPEGSEFARRLRLRRPDIEYLGLDRLGTLVRTDLARDPEIAALLRGCGCGGVLELAPHTRAGTIYEGYAARFRAHLGSAPGGLAVR